MMNYLYMMPLKLALDTLRQNGWMYSLFATIRGKAISTASLSVELAMGVAALIVVFKMIRMSYNLMSDEQTGGFGGITLWEILRPIVILLLIQGCTLWVGALDSVTNAVTLAVSSTVDAEGAKNVLLEEYAKSEAAQDAISKDALIAERAKGSAAYQKMRTTLDYTGLGGVGMIIDILGGEKSAENRAIRKYIRANEEDYDPERDGRAMRKAVNNWLNAMKHTTEDGNGSYVIDVHNNNFIPAVCCWLYDNLYIVIQSVAEIILMILAMCSPWVLVISLIEPWKSAIFSFISAYVQVSFWKVVAAMINMATIAFRTGTINFAEVTGREQINGLIDQTQGEVLNTTGAGILLSAIVSIAGVFCLLKIQDITAAIIPSASNVGSASGGAGTAKSAAGTPVVITEKAAGAALGGIKGLAGVKTIKNK